MIVWGGGGVGGDLNTGGRYNPATDTWTATSTTNAPEARLGHTAVWTGSEMIVWGGIGGSNTGGRYNPTTDSWTATSTTNAPSARVVHTAVWTGTEMIVWGGCTFDDCGNRLNTGGRYAPGTDSWTATSTAGAPSARGIHTAVWTDSEMIVWADGLAIIRTPAEGTTPERTVGQPPAPSTRPLPEMITRQCGPVKWSSGADIP
jgi:hypothetical protein